MKTKIAAAILFAGIIAISACKKGEGDGGKKKITGTVTYDDGFNVVNGIAPGATVFMTYGTLKATGTVDKTVTCDGIGTYTIKDLKKGQYFISGEYITSDGFRYTTTGYGITIPADKNSVELNLRLH